MDKYFMATVHFYSYNGGCKEKVEKSKKLSNILNLFHQAQIICSGSPRTRFEVRFIVNLNLSYSRKLTQNDFNAKEINAKKINANEDQ